MKKFLLGAVLALSLTSQVWGQIILEPETKLYTLRLGKAVIADEAVATMTSIRFYKPSSILSWIPIVRDMGISAGITLDEDKRYGVGLSYELNSIVDFAGGYVFTEAAESKPYLSLNLDISVFNQVIDYIQEVVK